MANRNVNFLRALAELTDMYDVAICSRNIGAYSEVFFQFYKDGKVENLDTKRLHSSPHELRLIANQIENEKDE